MYKKLLTACMALAAFAAFAVAPGTALAKNTPQLTAPTGTVLTAGSAIHAQNVGPTIFTSGVGNVECEVATMTGTVITNTRGNVQGEVKTADFKNKNETHCTGFGGTTVTTSPVAATGLPWCLSSTEAMATDEFRIRGGKCSEAARAITFTLDTTSLGACSYERKEAIAGTYTTHPNHAVLTITKVPFNKHGGFFCPSVGELDMSFTLTSGVNNVYIDK